MMLKCYSELLRLTTFKERYEYLRLDGVVGEETFGFDRYLNQIFYNSQEWKDIRRKIIIRDNGCDLGLDGYEIRGKILIHHMNPIRQQDILLRTDLVLNPEYLIATTLSTHNAIHYGDEKLLLTVPNERRKNDTCPWRHEEENYGRKQEATYGCSGKLYEFEHSQRSDAGIKIVRHYRFGYSCNGL